MRRSLTRTFAVAATLLIAAATSATALAATRPAPSRLAPIPAPCTRSAIFAGLHRGADAVPNGKLVNPFACSGRLAYAAVIIGPIETTQLLVATDGHWATTSRADYCNRGAVPKAIYQGACESN